MTPTFAFLAGFLCAACISTILALCYYARALRRVRSIQSAIQDYHKANKLVSEAADHAFNPHILNPTQRKILNQPQPTTNP